MLPFAGLKYMQVRAQNYLLGRTELQWQFMSNHFLIAEMNGLQRSNSYTNIFKISDLIYGGGISYGIATPIGPFKWTFSLNSEREGFASDVSIGFWF